MSVRLRSIPKAVGTEEIKERQQEMELGGSIRDAPAHRCPGSLEELLLCELLIYPE